MSENSGSNGSIIPSADQAERHRWLILAVIALAQLMIVLDRTHEVFNIAT